ncbi:putative phytepsin [Helianthus debilis subsp. tardiflorus]
MSKILFVKQDNHVNELSCTIAYNIALGILLSYINNECIIWRCQECTCSKCYLSLQCKHAAIDYGIGSISGYFSEDNIIVGGLVVENQFIEATRDIGMPFLEGKFDGILGLGFKETSVGNVVPIWYV